jgi:hypothetical protein
MASRDRIIVSDSLSIVSVLNTAAPRLPAANGVSAAPAPKLGKVDAPEQFEAFVLQSFIQEMLPKNAEGVFGGGIAGNIWKSMLAEKLGFEVAQRGSLGIAAMVRGNGADETRAQGEALRAASGLSNQLLTLSMSGAGHSATVPGAAVAVSSPSSASADGEK